MVTSCKGPRVKPICFFIFSYNFHQFVFCSLQNCMPQVKGNIQTVNTKNFKCMQKVNIFHSRFYRNQHIYFFILERLSWERQVYFKGMVQNSIVSVINLAKFCSMIYTNLFWKKFCVFVFNKNLVFTPQLTHLSFCFHTDE